MLHCQHSPTRTITTLVSVCSVAVGVALTRLALNRYVNSAFYSNYRSIYVDIRCVI